MKWFIIISAAVYFVVFIRACRTILAKKEILRVIRACKCNLNKYGILKAANWTVSRNALDTHLRQLEREGRVQRSDKEETGIDRDTIHTYLKQAKEKDKKGTILVRYWSATRS